ncbi:metal ABC transporter substrate-binding protein [Periweissella cryptocerci]|uniref:Metal ABC transporter substrate-binding protein n=1 Tax=Periweissella cryptocerci TaxID=2506420 RepID=A0A4P6YUD5_9LACO|nr:zinc ABC transporter substrate-binding protein [Periweissella cryptocerci]QBO36331.1 metal ABC transporter substrate-binding protein [Periweissella cryptocerci]
MKKMFTMLLVVPILILVAGCGQNTTAKNDKITVVASTDFYAQVAKTVLGDHGTATAVIHDSTVSPEEFEPTPKTAKLVAKANVVVANGLGYDSWLNGMAKSNGRKAQLIRVGEDVLHEKVGVNPHVWNNPANMQKLATKLAADFAKKDPKNKADYEANAQKYVQQLKPVTDMVAQLKAQGKGKAVAVTEPVYDLMLSAVGYKISDQDFAEEIEEGADPKPNDLQALQNDLKNHKVQFLVENTQSSGNIISSIVKLAKQANVPVVKVTETLPTGENYVSWQLNSLKQIQKIQEEAGK